MKTAALGFIYGLLPNSWLLLIPSSPEHPNSLASAGVVSVVAMAKKIPGDQNIKQLRAKQAIHVYTNKLCPHLYSNKLFGVRFFAAIRYQILKAFYSKTNALE